MDMVDGSMIWLQAQIISGNTRELKEKIFDLKKKHERIKVFFTEKEKN